MEIRIERVSSDRADELTQIAIAAKRHWGYPERRIEIWTPVLTFKSEDIQSADAFAAMIEDEIAGFYRLLYRASRTVLEDLWVRPEHIGKGIGRILFEHVLSRCTSTDMVALEVEADPHAQGFYEKMGMRKVRDKRGQLDDQVRILPVMEMEL